MDFWVRHDPQASAGRAERLIAASGVTQSVHETSHTHVSSMGSGWKRHVAVSNLLKELGLSIPVSISQSLNQRGPLQLHR